MVSKRFPRCLSVIFFINFSAMTCQYKICRWYFIRVVSCKSDWTVRVLWAVLRCILLRVQVLFAERIWSLVLCCLQLHGPWCSAIVTVWSLMQCYCEYMIPDVVLLLLCAPRCYAVVSEWYQLFFSKDPRPCTTCLLTFPVLYNNLLPWLCHSLFKILLFTDPGFIIAGHLYLLLWVFPVVLKWKEEFIM